MAVRDDCPQYIRRRVLDLIQRLIHPTAVADGVDARTTRRIHGNAQQERAHLPSAPNER